MADHGRVLRFARTLLVGCWAAITCAGAIAGEPGIAAADGEDWSDLQIISIDDFLVSNLVEMADARPTTEATAAESPVVKRILANWRARHQRIQSFHLAWNAWQAKLENANSPDAHSEVWVERDLRHRVVTSSPPNRVVSISAFDGMVRRRWDAERREGEIWRIKRGRAHFINAPVPFIAPLYRPFFGICRWQCCTD